VVPLTFTSGLQRVERFAPGWRAPSSGLIADTNDLSREPGMLIETMLRELVLVALLLALVVLSGQV